MRYFTVILLMGLTGFVSSETAPGSTQIQDALIAKDVIARQPVEPGSEFPPNVNSLLFWTKVKTKNYPTTITHVWYYQTREIFRIELKVNSSSWRTWSRITVYPHQPGDWKALALDASGAVLKEVPFKIIEQAPATTNP